MNFMHKLFWKKQTREEKIREELKKTTGYDNYNLWNNRDNGYHSYNIEEINISGQRNPKQRLDEFRKYVEFKDKIVVDFGCNVGAMLHHLNEIKRGIGFDYDLKCIEAAKNISKILGRNNLRYYQHDFDKDSYDRLKSKIDEKVDISFLLSLGSWIASWKELYALALEVSDVIILEINNMEEGQEQLEFFNDCNVTEIIPASLDDITGNTKRKTYLITKRFPT